MSGALFLREDRDKQISKLAGSGSHCGRGYRQACLEVARRGLANKLADAAAAGLPISSLPLVSGGFSGVGHDCDGQGSAKPLFANDLLDRSALTDAPSAGPLIRRFAPPSPPGEKDIAAACGPSMTTFGVSCINVGQRINVGQASFSPWGEGARRADEGACL